MPTGSCILIYFKALGDNSKMGGNFQSNLTLKSQNSFMEVS